MALCCGLAFRGNDQKLKQSQSPLEDAEPETEKARKKLEKKRAKQLKKQQKVEARERKGQAHNHKFYRNVCLLVAALLLWQYLTLVGMRDRVVCEHRALDGRVPCGHGRCSPSGSCVCVRGWRGDSCNEAERYACEMRLRACLC